MTMTVEEIYGEAQSLSQEDRVRLVRLLLLAPQADTDTLPAISPLGERLLQARERIVASGVPLLDREALATEIAERRGER